MINFVEWIFKMIESVSSMKNFNPKDKSTIPIDKNYITDFLPLESMSKLIPNPLIRTKIAELIGVEFKFEYPWGSVIACLIWSTIFIIASYWILKKKDW
ncbi:MAG: hypothetical protein DI529_16570 [Chryseobacterium sp.]|nr:MAG: hypothetical protein DI529_16570 [Chryseobacterium sp.]